MGDWRRLNPWRGLGELPREMWVLSTATLVNRAGSMVLVFLVLYLTRVRGLSPGAAGAVLALYGAGALVAAPVAGRLGDRFGPIRIMRASLVLSGTVLLLFPLAKTLPGIIAAVLALSVTAEAFRPANMAIIGDLVQPAQRKTAFSLNRLSINLGMSVGPALGGLLATVAFHWLFIVDGATSLAAGVILLAARFPPHQHSQGIEQASALPHPDRAALHDRRLVYFLMAAVLPIALVFFQHISSMSIFLVQELGLTEAAYGLLFSVNTLLIVLIEVPLNTATALWPHRRTLSLGALLCGVGFGSLALAWNFWSAAVTVVVWTFGEMFFFPGMAAYVTDLAPARRRGEYMGVSQMVMGLAFLVGPWAGTAVLQHFGGRVVWVAAFCLSLAAAALIGRMQEPAHQDARAAVPRPTAVGSSEP